MALKTPTTWCNSEDIPSSRIDYIFINRNLPLIIIIRKFQEQILGKECPTMGPLKLLLTSNSFPKSLPDLTNKFTIERVDYLNIYYMTRDLTDQKGCGPSKAIRWYRYSLP